MLSIVEDRKLFRAPSRAPIPSKVGAFLCAGMGDVTFNSVISTNLRMTVDSAPEEVVERFIAFGKDMARVAVKKTASIALGQVCGAHSCSEEETAHADFVYLTCSQLLVYCLHWY